MKLTGTFEDKLLRHPARRLNSFAEQAGRKRDELRLQLLEAAAARIGGFDLVEFQHAFGIIPLMQPSELMDTVRTLVTDLEATGIPFAIVLSALAREQLNEAERRSSGAYHTDFRLALHLTEGVAEQLRPGVQIVDPACGAGMLLAAVSTVACGRDRVLANEWLRHSVHASDLSSVALRGTLLSLASLTSDIQALVTMRNRWLVQDSLLAPAASWEALAPGGFDLVVANPPWEKVRLTRHEFSRAQGAERHYGASYDVRSLAGYEAAKDNRTARARRLVQRYPTLSAGEPDLYVAFTELLLRLTRPGGWGALLVPAGLIRSKGTETLRRMLVEEARALSLTVLENRARHFPIDTRFKFLSVQFRRAEPDGRPLGALELRHARGSNAGIEASAVVRLPLKDLVALRPDLTLPEVRSAAEWRLFRHMQAGGLDPADSSSPWYPVFCREVDMTGDKRHFRREPDSGSLPLIEGRMVQPHRVGAKEYLSGEGRRAKWGNLLPGESRIASQFWMPLARMAPEARHRTSQMRAGFCDITGQTNERTMMAALIPPGVVCGNKVPTVLFPNDPSEERLLLWLAVVNSLPFDWLMRRVVTTTVNYFVLTSIRLPDLSPKSLPGRRLIEVSRRLRHLDRVGGSSTGLLWQIADLRAEADVLVATAYGCTDKDLRLLLDDFPLFDRGQPAIRGEVKSTVTRDLVLASWFRRKGRSGSNGTLRLDEARHIGAVAYLSSELSGNTIPTLEAENG